MKNTFLFLLISWLAALSPALAAPLATAYFSSNNGALFGLTLDGQALTRGPVRQLRVEQLTPGEHWAELAIAGPRRSVVRLRSKVWLEPAAENRFVLVARNGRTPELRAAGTFYFDVPPTALHFNHDSNDSNPPSSYNEPGTVTTTYHMMSSQDVETLAASLKQRSFEATRLEVAKDALSQAGLYALDLQRLLRSFDFDASRVELAKFAYARVADPQNFYRVYEVFQFDSSVQEVRRAIGQR